MVGLKQNFYTTSTWVIITAGLMSGLILLTLFFASEAKRTSAKYQNLLEEQQKIDAEIHRIEAVMKRVDMHAVSMNAVVMSAVSTERELTQKTESRLSKIRSNLADIGKYRTDKERTINLVSRVKSIGSNTQKLEYALRGFVTVMKHSEDVFRTIPSITPASGWVSSFYGERHSPFSGKTVVHRGIDIGSDVGQEVIAPAEGIVEKSGISPTFGKFIVIKHAHNIKTRYGHNSALFVRKGQKIRRGQKIAEIGSTGRSTGPHLHYEVWVNNVAVDPSDYLLDRKLEDVSSSSGTVNIGGEEI